MSNRIEQVIGDIEEYIDGCKMQAFSNTKIIVDRPQIEEFLDELRKYTPEEVKKYQRMLNNRDKILADAKKKAAETEDKARAYADHIVSESEITKQAYERANEILQDAVNRANELMDAANEEAQNVREGALGYTNDMLGNLISIISGTIEDCNERYTDLMNTLTDHKNIVVSNQKELQEANQKMEGENEAKQPFFESDAFSFNADLEEEDD